MSTFMQFLLGSSAGAAIIAGLFTVIHKWIDSRNENKKHDRDREEHRQDSEDLQNQALRYIMLYIIQERAKELIRRGNITVDERRSLHAWHDLYHDGLLGNGDATGLMKAIDALPLCIE